MQVEANFTIKVAYLKFQEQLKRKSSQLDNDVDQSRLSTTVAKTDDIFLQPNFEKHTNLFQDFKQLQFAASLQRHGIKLERFEELLSVDNELRLHFDTIIHFPFVGLVKEYK